MGDEQDGPLVFGSRREMAEWVQRHRQKERLLCAWCGDEFDGWRRGDGPHYCKPSHRNSAYLKRRRAQARAAAAPQEPPADE